MAGEGRFCQPERVSITNASIVNISTKENTLQSQSITRGSNRQDCDETKEQEDTPSTTTQAPKPTSELEGTTNPQLQLNPKKDKEPDPKTMDATDSRMKLGQNSQLV
jgi:hypothetical protein